MERLTKREMRLLVFLLRFVNEEYLARHLAELGEHQADKVLEAHRLLIEKFEQHSQDGRAKGGNNPMTQGLPIWRVAQKVIARISGL